MLLLTLALLAGVAQAQQPQTIDSIRVIGNRRIPKETILARLFTHPGDTYDPISIERDFNSLWNTGYFENLRIEREDSEKGIILDIFVKEKPTIREINYKGLNAVSVSDVLDRFKKEKVGLSVESQYDPAKVLRATAVLKDILSEHGHQFAVIKLDIKDIPPASVQVNFNIKEGPTVKVGKIKFTGNQHISSLVLRRSMKNLKPIGIPYSIIFEDLFPQTFDSSKLEEDTERVRQAYRDKGYYNAAIEEPKTQIRDQGGLNWFTFRPNKGKRIDILMPIEEGARYRSGHHHLHRQQGGDQRQGPARHLRREGRRLVQRHADRQGPGEPEEGLRSSWATSTSAPFPSPSSTNRRRPSRWSSISTRASRFTFPASSSRATPLRATRSFAAN